MREILFRGKTFDGKWEQGDLRHGGYIRKDTETYIMRADYALHNIPVDSKTVGQYTGLTDKNGTKIFEGDIVNFKTTAYHFKKCRIKYQSCYARYCAIDNKGYEYPMDKTFEYEVIGNIHDNPESLGGNNNAE